MNALFPLAFANEETRLLTALVLGFLFGFSLERAGFGNARKLAAQFYLYDMTVFKVMFTAILVAMVGLYALVGIGMVDLSLMWINPTFVWAQVVGGFLLGVGFILSGLCPGTSVVSAASGRWDGLMAFGGIVLGMLLFTFVVDWFPIVERLYEGGAMGESVLPRLMHVPTPVFVLSVVAAALAAFIGAEKVERMFSRRYTGIELAPRVSARTPRLKFAVGGVLALVIVLSAAGRPSSSAPLPVAMEPVAPLDLAERIIARDPNLLILDMRTLHDAIGGGIAGAYPVSTDSAALALLDAAARGTVVVVYDATGIRTQVPEAWPRTLSFRYLRGGLAGWRAEVLTPLAAAGPDMASQALQARQAQIAAYFSGAAVAAPAIEVPLPAMPTGGQKKKKKAGGC